ncbi:AGC/DMPK/GEK protein kinase [Capsaspora owczarzaki ATCC 30864]|uniref:non-specific serine/threonine protein kinase n=1 Tax=Capsaspora owczarzaki (strain ATCC 30864) TaxID=595528 RepID=A0A0D2WNL2_CAPO3|nr:AGC/DMPK/GEK protein kinase [Capsaspora owczarzaki ATCC 30864]
MRISNNTPAAANPAAASTAPAAAAAAAAPAAAAPAAGGSSGPTDAGSLRKQLDEALAAQKNAETLLAASKDTIRELEAQVKKAVNIHQEDGANIKRKKIMDACVYDPTESGLPVPLTVDALVDGFMGLYAEARAQSIRNSKQHLADFLERYESTISMLKLHQFVKEDFVMLKTIGRGSFAESVCFRNELDFLILAAHSSLHNGQRAPGITALQSAFHDRTNVYLVMDFYAGGDLLGLLGKREQFSEEMARFYIAELVLAIDTVHKLGYVHRDIKIENLLLDNKGHVYLADFGSCSPLNEEDEAESYLSGGTPDYLSPELLAAMEGDEDAIYGADCDWWSLGCVMYEMLVGETPFYADSVLELYKNIKNYKSSLHFPNDVPLSDHAKDLIRRLCTGRDDRIGSLGVDEIMEHPFFADISWTKLRKSRTPFVPELASSTDTAFFEDFDPIAEEGAMTLEPLTRRASSAIVPDTSFGNHLPFIGYVFHKEDEEPVPVQKRFKNAALILQGNAGLVSQIMGSPLPGSPVLRGPSSPSLSSMPALNLGSPVLQRVQSLNNANNANAAAPPPLLRAASDPKIIEVVSSVRTQALSQLAASGMNASSSSLVSHAAPEALTNKPRTIVDQVTPLLRSVSDLTAGFSQIGGSSGPNPPATVAGAAQATAATTPAAVAVAPVSAAASSAPSAAVAASAAAATADIAKVSEVASPAAAATAVAVTDSAELAAANSEAAEDAAREARSKVKFVDTAVFFDAARNGDFARVKSYIEAGKLSVTSTTELERTCLHVACQGGQLPIVEYLISKGADINAVDYNLATPLHLAAFEDAEDVVRFLIDHGADLEATNVDDERPVDVCGDDDLTDYIQSRMAA